MQFLLFWEEKFYASCTLKDKNFAPKQNERDCPMTNGARKSSVYADFRALAMWFEYRLSTKHTTEEFL